MAKIFRRLAIGAALIAALLLLLSGPGTRFGLWEYGTGFLMMRIAFFVGLGAAALALLMLVIPKTRVLGALPLVVALALGLGTAYLPWSGVQKVRSLPFIHDITTDTENPPAFVAVLPLRVDAPNPPEYLGEEVASRQRESYPDIKTVTLEMPADQTFARALEVVEAMGWELVASEPSDGRIEATETTFWFGFKDDVVIRIAGTAGGSRLDVRSKSRVGRSDVGANAERIRKFMQAFQG
ncbi:DUF1499 domain-containing protein [Congregibacter variabilis]|uniref:DUF1499 domain-containing protein n=1 Tax=Congregibacter variabilis TaxID=3081200 RepID=A0ABZ0I2Q1_9GAMM|nr:DUF1499 domain-containing protein [Congregibacter sp. IMCC43200]